MSCLVDGGGVATPADEFVLVEVGWISICVEMEKWVSSNYHSFKEKLLAESCVSSSQH